MGFWKKQHDYMDDFQTQNWSRLSEKERLNRLQSLENDMAKEQGRAARKVEPCPSNYCGWYDRDQPDKIFINQDYLDRTLPCDQYDAMNTVLHEGRHAYQHDCVEGKIHNPPENSETLSMWSKNNTDEIYIDSSDFSRYRFQPIEADANDYTDTKMESFSSRYSKDTNYENYINSTIDVKQDDINNAIKNIGPNYQQNIADKINDDYAWNHRHIPTQEEQDQAFSKLCEYGEKHYGEDWRQMSGELVRTDPEFRNLYQTSFPNHRLPPVENVSANMHSSQSSSFQNGSVTPAENSQRGPLPPQSEPNNKAAERGSKPLESDNNIQNNNSITRGEKPQEALKGGSNAHQLQRETPPDSSGGEDSRAPTSSSSNPNDKISASNNSAKAADEASKAASEQAAKNTVAKSNGMGM